MVFCMFTIGINGQRVAATPSPLFPSFDQYPCWCAVVHRFHRTSSPDGGVVYRLGYKMVTAQSEPGVGVTVIGNQSEVKTQWISEIPKGHDMYMTMNVFKNASTTPASFISLAPSLADRKRGLDVVCPMCYVGYFAKSALYGRVETVWVATQSPL